MALPGCCARSVKRRDAGSWGKAEAPARLAAQLLAESGGDKASVALPTSELAPGRYKLVEKLGVRPIHYIFVATHAAAKLPRVRRHRCMTTHTGRY